MSLPLGVVVDSLIEHLEPHTFGFQAFAYPAKMREAETQAVKLGDHKHVTLTQVIQCSL
jgi:hypothetical protein